MVIWLVKKLPIKIRKSQKLKNTTKQFRNGKNIEMRNENDKEISKGVYIYIIYTSRRKRESY